MPSVSQKQHRAMEAAAHGGSTIGIPKSVGQEFVQADAAKKGRHRMTPQEMGDQMAMAEALRKGGRR